VKDLPPDVAPYKRTPEFSAASTPGGLLESHCTKPGTWGEIVVLEGSVLYRVLEPAIEEFRLTPDCPGIVAPTIRHQIEPSSDARFYVAFYRAP
jgi:tellurite resistance-related uncharacterized protein